jgi:hypothetical protein
MSQAERTGPDENKSAGAANDSEAALQRELRREADEGQGTIGDMGANRNVAGSSTWETQSPAVDGAQRDVADEIATRLRRDGIRLTGDETAEELVRVLEAVERFESAVRREGGDLMVDEPVGTKSPIAPDNRAFVLPRRLDQESISAFLVRIAEATNRAAKPHGDV